MASSWMENPTENDRLLLKRQTVSAFSGMRIPTHVEPYDYRVQKVEPRHQLCDVVTRYSGAMCKQKPNPYCMQIGGQLIEHDSINDNVAYEQNSTVSHIEFCCLQRSDNATMTMPHKE